VVVKDSSGNITTTGNATFGGDVTLPEGRVKATRATAGTAGVFSGFLGSTLTSEILANGSATFADGAANIYSNGTIRVGGNPGSASTIGADLNNDGSIRCRSSNSSAFRVFPNSSSTNEVASISNTGSATFAGEMLFRCTGITGDAPNATGARVYQNNGNCKVRGTSTTSSGTDTAFQFYHGTQTSAFQGKITVDNSSVSYHTSSDYRLKENVVDIADGITRIKQLAPKRFNFIVDAEKTVDGFLAHEAQTVVPEAVSGEKDATREEEYEVTPAVLNDDGEQVTPAVMGTRTVPDHQGIDQSKLVPLLTAALQEAISKIETLETKVAALEATP
jgi:hypothetical protein